MSWQTYVDDHLMCEIEGGVHLSAAAILGLDGSVWAQSHNFPQVNISPCEFITEIDMMVREYDGQSVITFLSIHTNVKTYGPFGKAKGSKIKIPINVGSLVGFFGRAGMYLNSLDIFEVVRPNTKNYDDKTVKSWTYLPQGSTTKIVIGHAEVINSIVFESKTDAGLVTASERFEGTDGHKTEASNVVQCMSIGPFGGPEDEGQLWTYKPQDGLISEIVIRYGSVIDSIVLQGKTTNGSVAYSRRFGGNGGNRTKKKRTPPLFIDIGCNRC